MTDPGSKLKLLYVTPERVVKSKTLMSKLEKAASQNLLNRWAACSKRLLFLA